jgi:hypothetical protein
MVTQIHLAPEVSKAEVRLVACEHDSSVEVFYTEFLHEILTTRDARRDERTMEITIVLTEAQAAAMGKLDLLNEGDAEKLAHGAFSSALRSKFKYMAEKAKKDAASAYEMMERIGVVMNAEKGAVINRHAAEIAEIMREL